MSSFGSKTAGGNARIFTCSKCEKSFTRDEHLTRHILSTHNKLKPFVCGLCDRPFSRRDLLLRHAKNLHEGLEKAINRLRKLRKLDSQTEVEIMENLDMKDMDMKDIEIRKDANNKMSVNMLLT